VKHEGWDKKLGKGKCCFEIPLRVIVHQQAGVFAKEPFQVPKEWHPLSGSYEATNCYHEQGKVSEYIQKVYIANLRKWHEINGIPLPQNLAAEYESVPG
jgi:hypothetical protein